MAEHLILKQKVYHNGRSMVVLKPGEKGEVPDRLVRTFVIEGIIPDPDEAPPEFEMHHLGFGKYQITGPGITEETIVKSKADAETFIERLKEAVNGSPSGETDVEGGEGANAASDSAQDAPAD